jgi:hypothetical protein
MDEDSLSGDCVCVDGLHVDTADTSARLNSDLDVALVAPGGGPRVLNQEVGGTILGTITNCEDTMIEVASAFTAGEDSGFVMLEDGLVSFDGHGNGLLGNSILQFVGGHRSNLGERGDFDGSLLEVFLALATNASSRGVGVVSLSVEGV